ncbi:MAG TPA: ester cyclase [Thermoleophilaceae bacterium]|nr:ester cyclase [Thermoleophilaceae bacterium]
MATESKTRTPEETVRSYFDAVIARDPDAMAEHWAEEGIEEILPVGIFRGPEEVKAYFTELFTAIPDFQMELERVLEKDNDVLVQWRASGTFSGGPLMGIDPTGRRIELRGLDWLEVEGDKVVRNTAFADGAALARGMGLLPPQGSAAEKTMFSAFNAFTKARGAVSEVLSR